MTLVSCGGNINVRMNYKHLNKSIIGDPLSKYSGDSRSFPVLYETNVIFKSTSGTDYRVLLYHFDIYARAVKSNSIYTYVAYAFENDSLFFFGMPEDFLKSDNEKANEVGMKLGELIKTTMENQ